MKGFGFRMSPCLSVSMGRLVIGRMCAVDKGGLWSLALSIQIVCSFLPYAAVAALKSSYRKEEEERILFYQFSGSRQMRWIPSWIGYTL